MAEEVDELVVAQVEVEAGGIGADLVAARRRAACAAAGPTCLAARSQSATWSASWNGRREGPLVAAARAADAMDERRRVAGPRGPARPRPRRPARSRPASGRRGTRLWIKPRPDLAAIVDQLERSDIGFVGANLAVADDAVAGELEAGECESSTMRIVESIESD